MDHETMETQATPAAPAAPGEASPVTWIPVAVEVAEMPRVRRSRRVLAVFAGTALIALTIGASAALANDPAAAPVGGAIPVDAAAADAAFKDFAACMREHGVDMPDPIMVSSDATIGGGPGDPGGTNSGVIVTGGTAQAVEIDGAAPAVEIDGAAPFDDAAFREAHEACSPILEAAGMTPGTGPIAGGEGLLDMAGAPGAGVVGVVAGGGDVSKLADEMKAYAACMRDNGQDVPDPAVDTTAGTVQLQVNGDPASEAFRAADAACSTGTFGFGIPIPIQH